MDARRKQVYTGIYKFENHEMITVEEQMAIGVEELIEKINAQKCHTVFLGDGVSVYKEMIEEKIKVPYTFAPLHMNKQRAGAIAALGMKYFKAGKIESATEHQQTYLRVSRVKGKRAEREAKRK